MAADGFGGALRLVSSRLTDSVDMDWSRRADSLDWTCWHTVDHVVDCLFSYALQVSSASPGPFLPFRELHARPEATTADLLAGLGGAGRLFGAALAAAPEGPCAGDGVVQMDVDGWAQRGSYELLIRAHDILRGLGRSFVPPTGLCSWLLASETLWMLDRGRVPDAESPWPALLLGSGRSAASA